MTKIEVFAKVVIEGLHNWKTCPHEEVSYLRDDHRHQFVIRAYKPVQHHDRDNEFIMLQHKIRDYILSKYADDDAFHGFKLCYFGSMSCEMIGQELMDKFELSRIEVSEDDENGAILTNDRL